MSVYRLAACRGLRTHSRGAGCQAGHLIRWQSSGAGPGKAKGGGALKKIIIGAGVIGVAGAGVLVYGNYDPVFRNQVDEKIPGFGRLTDRAADVWVNVTDYFNPKPGVPKKGEDEKFVLEYNKAKSKARLEELKKGAGQPAPKDKNNVPTNEKGGTVPGQKGKVSEQKGKTVPEQKEKLVPEQKGEKASEQKGKTVPEQKGGGAAPEQKTKVDDKVDPKESSKEKPISKSVEKAKSRDEVKSKSEATTSDKPKPKAGAAKKQAKPEEEVTSDKKSKPDAVASTSKEVPSEKSKQVTVDTVEESRSEKTPEKSAVPSSVPQVPSPPVVVPLGSSDVAEQETGSKKTGAGDNELEEEIEREIASDIESAVVESPKMDAMLDESHRRFVSDVSKVRDAQQDLTRAWKHLYTKLTATYSDDGLREKAVAEAKDAASTAHTQLKEAARTYDRSILKLKELLERAPAEGFMAKAADIAGSVGVREAEVDLGMVIVKEAVASAVVMEGYREAIQESKDKLQKDLEAASSLIDPERKDSLILSLNKRAELLDDKLKEVEADHAQKIALALEVQRRSLEQLAEDKIEHVVKEGRAKYRAELVKEMNRMSERFNGKLREQLRLENESHAREMEEALKDQAEELSVEWSAEMDAKLSEQQGFYQTELARARARLHGLEAMVDGVANAGEKTLQLQALRNSSATLTRALELANLEYDETYRYSIASELNSLRQVAGEDPFISLVLGSIPSRAVDGVGIQSESSLRERFVRVKRICKRVALVPEAGGGLGTYAISYIQSLVTLHAFLPEESPADTDLSKLHVYNLLRLAEARLKKGDLEGAVHYMNYLHGDSKNVAKDWIMDARAYLETRQAIQLIQAYISANAAVFAPAQN